MSGIGCYPPVEEKEIDMTQPVPPEEEYTGLLPRRFRKFGYALVAAASGVVLIYNAVSPEELDAWVNVVATALGLSAGSVAAVNTRGTVTRD